MSRIVGLSMWNVLPKNQKALKSTITFKHVRQESAENRKEKSEFIFVRNHIIPRYLFNNHLFCKHIIFDSNIKKILI